MSKNAIIGILLVVLVFGGGYYMFKNKGEPTIPDTSSTSSTSSKIEVPTVKTSQNVSVSNSTAVVSGQVEPNGALTKYWFEYGETTALGTRTVEQQIGSGFSPISSPAYIVGLKANTTYYFRLSASNRLGTVNGDSYSFQTNSTPPVKGAAPTAQTNSATGVTRTTANINGQVNPNGWQTSYWFEYGKDINLGNISSIESVGDANTPSTLSISISNLEPLTKYYFRLNAQNQYGTVNGSILNFTTIGPANNSSSPTVNTNGATNVTNSGATFKGQVNPNGADTTYWFEYSQDSLLGSLIGSGTSPQMISAGNNNTAVEANVSGLARDTKYFYRLVGRNSYGVTQGGIVSFSTKK